MGCALQQQPFLIISFNSALNCSDGEFVAQLMHHWLLPQRILFQDILVWKNLMKVSAL